MTEDIIMSCLVKAIAHLMGTVINEYEAMVERWLAEGEKKKNLEKKPIPVPYLPRWISVVITQDWAQVSSGDKKTFGCLRYGMALHMLAQFFAIQKEK
jgi:hypothetical protein